MVEILCGGRGFLQPLSQKRSKELLIQAHSQAGARERGRNEKYKNIIQRDGGRMSDIDWRRHIHSDPEILLGKPVVKGTRLSVEFILGLFAEGWTEQQILENYPTLTRERLRAVFSFTKDCMREESLYAISSGTE